MRKRKFCPKTYINSNLEQKQPEMKKFKKGEEDEEAKNAFASALTKEDSLDDQFAAGNKDAVTLRLTKQVAEDLVKDYDSNELDANKRSSVFVKKTIGKLFGDWKKDTKK